jgi:two-component system, NtrC family, sensor kinase
MQSASALDERSAAALGVVEDAVARIERVTRDLLDLSRIDRDQVHTWIPSDAIDSALRLLKARSSEGAEVAFSNGVSVTIEGRPAELNQMVLNVIDNALRAAGSRGKVEVALRLEQERCVIEVADTGPGIPREVLPRIFDPFFTTRLGGEGTGLGLSIVKRIVTDHLGTIDVRCPEQGGTVVTIGLPVHRAQDIVQSEASPA